MAQKPAVLGYDDIKRIAKRDFPQLDFVEVESVLRLYDADVKESKNRVFAAILKLADGNVESLKYYTQAARVDYRDVIYWAEYPSYSDAALKGKKGQSNVDDWHQYQTWLNKV